MNIKTVRFTSRTQLDAALASRLADFLATADAASAPLALMLAGGTTPLPAYREVGQRKLTAARTLRLLYSDDRYVPATSPSSNYHQTRPLLDGLAIPEAQVLRVRTELPLAQAALDYEAQLTALLASGARVGLGLLGLGADGHTASLFGPEDLASARGHLAIAVQRPDGMAGVSVTPELLRQVDELLFVVAGGGKYDAIQSFLKGDPDLVALAAVAGCKDVQLWLDQEAASSLYA
jgi:6-phosphogluconolactonase